MCGFTEKSFKLLIHLFHESMDRKNHSLTGSEKMFENKIV